MMATLPRMLGLLVDKSSPVLFRPDFFEIRYAENLDKYFKSPKPVLQLEGVDLSYNVGTRTNGVDKAVWPEDLSVEVVA